MENIERIKADLWLRSSLRNLKDERYRDENKKIAQGIARIPVNKIYDQVLYLENELLPKLEKARGKNSVDYEFFADVVRSLCWAVLVIDRNDLMERRYHYLNIKHELLTQHAAGLERELLKYSTVEDFLYSSGLDGIASGIATRAAEILNKKPK